jgi:phage I-like protein
MSGKNTSKALAVIHGLGVEISFNAEGGGAAEWIMLLPIGAGGLVTTVDGRGPYRVADAGKLAANALSSHSGRIPIDENHATDLAAPAGRPAPALGWVTEMQARPDGIYGRVEWSAPGAALMGERAYRFISPVLIHDKAGNVLDLPRASLVNMPNLRGMAALNAQQETDSMDLLEQLRKLLGLDDTADAGAVISKVKGLAGTDTAMQSIAKAAGLQADATSESILTTVTTLAGAAKSGGAETITALQSEIRELGERLATALSTTAREKATAFVDGAIREGRVGVKPLRDHFISRHAANIEGAAAVEKEIGALPKIGNGGAMLPTTPPAREGEVALNAAQLETARLLGIKPEDYAKTLASEAASAA